MPQRMRQRRQQGQSLPIVVLMLGTLFMIIGLGIDGGLLYAQRRLMQNTADAACLAAATRLAMGETNLQAEAAARQVIANNLGATPGSGANAPGTLNYGAIAELYTPVTGSGVNLSRGIVLTGPEIRVALASSAFTYFLRVLGQEAYTVAARARCDATAGGGGSPFAVARWRAYRASNGNLLGGLSTDLSIANQNLGQGNPPFFVRDVLGQYSATLPDPSRITEWPGWGSPTYPGSPNATPPTGLFSQATTPATPQNPGIEVAIAGNDATANQGSSTFAGQVLLDWRNITLGGEFYGGISPNTNPNTYKDIVTRHIVEGYNGSWILPGTQLGFTNGVSAGQVEQPFNLRNPTLPFTMPVLIYNGTVYENINLQLLQTSAQPQTKGAFNVATQLGQDQFPVNCLLGAAQGSYMYDIVGGQPLSTTETLNLTPLVHTVTLRPYMGNNINNSPAVQSGARIRSFASVNGSLWNDLQVQVQTTLAGSSWLDVNNQGVAPPFPGLGQPGININNTLARPFNLRVQQSRRGSCFVFGNATANPPTQDQEFILPVKPVQGPAAIYLEAEDTNTGVRRGRYVLIGTGGTDANNFYAYFPNTLDYEPIDRPSTGTNTVNVPFEVEYTNGNNVPFNNQLTFSNYTWFEEGHQIGAPADIGVTVVQGQGNRPNLRITVGPNAPINRNFHVRVQVTHNGRTQWLWYYVRVRLPVGNSNNVTQYIYTLGYANFRVTRTTANNIYGVAVSGLLRPGDVIVGMQPRLLPWED